MAKRKLPPSTFHVSAFVLKPGENYHSDQALWAQVSRLQTEGRYRTALLEVLAALDKNPHDEGLLRLAAIIISGSISKHLQASEPIPPALFGDSRLDPIFTQCSHCKVKKNQWVAEGWLLGFENMVITNPAGMQCQDCGYVMCRDCLKENEQRFGLGYATYTSRCPNCGHDGLSTLVYPTGRSPAQMTRRKEKLLRFFIFREGPLMPDGEYVREILENVYPPALEPGVIFTCVPVSPWPEDIETFAIIRLLIDGIKLMEGSCDWVSGVDHDGSRVYFVRVFEKSLPFEPLVKTTQGKVAALPGALATRGSALLRQAGELAHNELPSPLPFLHRWFAPGTLLRRVVSPLLSPLQLAQARAAEEAGRQVDGLMYQQIPHVLNCLQGHPSHDIARAKLENRLLVAKVRTIALEEMKKAFRNGCHLWRSFASPGLGIVVSAIPTLDAGEARRCFEGSLEEFLEGQARVLNLEFGRCDLAHWVLCSDRKHFKVYLSFAAADGMAVWAHELMSNQGKE